MPFEVIPAIDIRGGKCVRLYQGDYARETVFSGDPAGVARRWQECGAPRIHVVDLDGAAAGAPANVPIIQEIIRAVSIPIEVGGGLRTPGDIEALLAIGTDRVVLGTAAAEDPALVAEAARRHGDRLVVGIDARNGMVATHGWKTTQRIRAVDLLATMEKAGVRRVIYTDIARDGALNGPNLQAIGDIVGRGATRIIASGGVSCLDHVRALARMDLDGVIIGRALYTGAVDLGEALAAAASPGDKGEKPC